MGQQSSKRTSDSFSTSTLTKYSSAPTSPISPLTPCSPGSDITSPSTPKELTRISEILDPRELLQDQIYNVTPSRPRQKALPQSPDTPTEKKKTGLVHSPSGNMLEPEEFIAHPNRPLAMWERQQRVIQATKEGLARYEAESRLAESRLGNRSRLGSRVEPGAKKKRRCNCWPFG